MTKPDVMTQLDTMTHVQRTPTIPMTKRESVASNGTRVSLLNNNGATAKKWESKDYVNTHTGMVAGRKRSPRTTKKVKRTDSYKIALNRESVFSTLEDSAIADSTLRTNGHTSGLSRCEDRKKYNTLPRTVPSTESIIVETKRAKHENDSSKKRPEFDRNASQRSGTCPSPDTDTDQQSVMTDRKKKSPFKRMKERLILTFKRDRDRENVGGRKKGKKNARGPSRTQVKPKNRTSPNHRAFGTPSDTIETSELNSEITNDSSVHVLSNGVEKQHGDEDGSSSDKKGGFLRSIRNSMRRKSLKRSKSKSSADQKWSAPQTSITSQSQTSSSMERETFSNGGSKRMSSGQSHQNKTGKSRPTHYNTQPDIIEVEETFGDANDSITGLFESLIDPRGPAGRLRHPRPDTSKFRLEGLHKCKPRSPVHEAPKHAALFGALGASSDLEFDGVDEADGVPHGIQDFGLEEGLEFADVSQTERQRRMDGVARRLAVIGDSIVNKRESESAGSSLEDNQQRELEQGLLRDLRQYGDDIDGTLFGPNNKITVNVNILPIVSKIIRAQNYSGFTTVVQQELRDTVGWEQVAWYTYLMKSAMCLASTGKTVGSLVKRHAKRYFSSNLQPWIRDRPKGWESIQEETDVESELD